MTYKYSTFSKWINILVDYSLLNLVLVLCFAIDWPFPYLEINSDLNKLHFLLINLFWFFCTSQMKLYEGVLTKEAIPTLQATSLCLIMFLLAPIIMDLGLPRFSLNRDFSFQVFLIFSICIISWKIIFLLIRKSKRSSWIESKRIVILGAGPLGMNLFNYFKSNPHLGYIVEGVFDDTFSPESGINNHLAGKVSDSLAFSLTKGVSEIFSTLPAHDLEKVKSLMLQADHHMMRFRLVPDIQPFLDKHVLLEFHGSMPILTPRREPLEDKVNEIIKQIFDRVFASLVIVFILSWLTPVLAILIKLDSKGSVFFRQQRSGKGNKPFYCYKFRSMRVNHDADILQASKGDMRVTRIGAILRKTSLDELPQFFNVWLGNMSIVGPRPHMLKHTQDYALLINNFMVRQFLTPGITGWAQVNGYRGETKEPTSMTKRVEADLWYLENWSFLLDLKIIFLTIWAIIKGNEEAY